MSEEMLAMKLRYSEIHRARLSRILSYVLVKFHNRRVELPLEAINSLEEGGVTSRKVGESLIVSGFTSDEAQDKYAKEYPVKNGKSEEDDRSEILSKLSDLINKIK